MVDVIHATHRIHDGLGIAHITHIELQRGAVVLLAHVVLLFFIAAQNANLAHALIQKPAQDRVTERTGTTSDQQDLILKYAGNHGAIHSLDLQIHLRKTHQPTT